jgi:uncharacterized membrane protein YphA (DoxX/SURF4 family)
MPNTLETSSDFIKQIYKFSILYINYLLDLFFFYIYFIKRMSLRKFINYFIRILSSPWPYRVVRFAIGSLFVYAGFIKLSDPRAFASVLSQYGLIPDILLAPVAIALPALEFLAGIGLIFNIRGSLTIIFSMLILFVMVLWYGILRDLDIYCGCFTVEELRGYNTLRQAFNRDLMMIGGLAFLFVSRWFCPDQNKRHSLWSKIKSIKGGS